MKKDWIVTVVFAALFLCFTPAFAHTAKTAGGCQVSHTHPGYCGPWGCPDSDSSFEKKYSFKATDRKYSGTGTYNCHGRTFDGRQSWIGNPASYLSCGGTPSCPVTPRAGDTILFYSGGQIVHSVTIVGAWAGVNTQVMSKYGTQGQYQHALSNTIRAYPVTWYVTRFGSGTRIYTTAEPTPATEPAIPEMGAEPLADRLARESVSMPWHKDVVASLETATLEHDQIVREGGALSEGTVTALRDAKNRNQRVALLMNDLQDSQHYVGLGAYDSPALTTDYIDALEAANQLIAIARTDAASRRIIFNALRDVVRGSAWSDPANGAALHIVKQIATPAERARLLRELADQQQLDDEGISYRSFYGHRLSDDVQK